MGFDKPNPISLGLPAEHVSKWAVDTHALERHVARMNAANASQRDGAARSAGGAGQGADGRLRPYAYKMPYVTVNDLKKRSKGWREFLCTDFLSKSYGFPRGYVDAKRRLDSNAFEYLGNYRAVVFFIFAAVLYNKPLALARTARAPRTGSSTSWRGYSRGRLCSTPTSPWRRVTEL